MDSEFRVQGVDGLGFVGFGLAFMLRHVAENGDLI